MIVIKLMGGLGNQMFQYALGRYLSWKHCTDLKLDISFYYDNISNNQVTQRKYSLDIFNVVSETLGINSIHYDDNIYTKKPIVKIIDGEVTKFLNVIKEPELFYKQYSKIYSCTDDQYLIGYWQNFKYLTEIEQLLKQDFFFKNPLNLTYSQILKCIQGTESVCLHVRRGDYVTNFNSNAFHGVCEEAYFQKAIELIKVKIKKPRFFIFTDDIDWCRNNFILDDKSVLVSEIVSESLEDEFQLMTFCKHFIISNSTFGVWAAWICDNPNKVVVAPHIWFKGAKISTKNITPKGWLRMNV